MERATDAKGKKTSHLETYGELFNCVEINSSFYRSHSRKTYERWAESVPGSFRFSVKLPKAVTHEARLLKIDQAVTSFIEEISGLGPKLGCVLIQLPPSLKYAGVTARHFLKHLRDSYSGMAVIEPRHASWFAEEAEELLRSFEVGRVAADPAPVPGAELPGGLLDALYVRLHGSPRMYYSAYSEAFLQSVKTTLKGPAEQRWCIFDNTAEGAAFTNAQELQRLVKR